MLLMAFMKLTGRFSLKDLIDFYGKDFDPEELLELIEEGVVSVHYDGVGNAWHRYPYFTTKTEARVDKVADKGLDSLLEYIRANPLKNGAELKKGLKLSQEAFDARKEKLLDAGLIQVEKDGRALLYRVATKKKLVQSSAVGLGKPAVPLALGEDRDGRFKFERSERELSELDQRILAELEKFPDDRVVTHLAEDLGQKDERAFRKTLAKLHRDGYIGKVVEGEDTLWCSLKQV